MNKTEEERKRITRSVIQNVVEILGSVSDTVCVRMRNERRRGLRRLERDGGGEEGRELIKCRKANERCWRR